jgi:hypothetical protein
MTETENLVIRDYEAAVVARDNARRGFRDAYNILEATSDILDTRRAAYNATFARGANAALDAARVAFVAAHGVAHHPEAIQ